MAEGCRHPGKAFTIGPLEIQREYEPDRQAMLAALRVVLDLPRIPSMQERLVHGSGPQA
jgi:hypothetical protein